MHIQAGTVIGGITLSRRPYAPAAIKPRRLGRSSNPNSNSGAAQSRPRTRIFIEFVAAEIPASREGAAPSQGERLKQPFPATRRVSRGTRRRFTQRRQGITQRRKEDKCRN